ncbi:hypothetical protein Ae706Ps2_6730 [Pseudonocardia sp. Ae706_Ps2]|nr:hypothetical protein Ae706Ps2_6730 [Pseudonocardia sp. Ae706_Ps2]
MSSSAGAGIQVSCSAARVSATVKPPLGSPAARTWPSIPSARKISIVRALTSRAFV